jgi:hypothetical protein
MCFGADSFWLRTNHAAQAALDRRGAAATTATTSKATMMSDYPTLSAFEIEAGFQALARWANNNPRPKPPNYIPGLPGVNQQLHEKYKDELITWKIGKTEAFMHGLRGCCNHHHHQQGDDDALGCQSQ